MDQRLRLVAELKNNASPGIRQIGKDLKEIRRSPGMEQAQKWFSGVSESAAGFARAGAIVSGIMGAIGVGGLTAATSLAVLVKQFKDLGDHTFAMKRLGQETGLTIDQVKRWEYVGQIFRVPTEQMDAALKTLGDQMVDFRRRRGELFGQLNQVDPGEASKLLGMKDPNAQFAEILRWLSTIKDAAARNRWTREFFGTDELGSLLTNGFPALEKAMEKARSKVAPITPEMSEQADKLADAIVDLNQAWENFELNVGPQFLGQLTDIVHTIETVFKWLNKTPTEAAHDAAESYKGWRDSPEFKKYREDVERQKKDEGIPENDPFAGLKHKSSYNSSGSLFHLAAFRSGGSDDPIAGGVKEGVLAAFREWAAQSSASPKAGGNGLMTQASFRDDDGQGQRFGGRASGGGGRHHGSGTGEGPADLRGFGGKRGGGRWWTADRQAHAVDRLMKEAGLSEEGAEGLVSRWKNVEAGAGPTAYNRSSGAAGIAQWLGSRKHGFTADYDSQISHAIKELNGPEFRAGRALRAARSARDAAIGASMYERAEHYNPRSGADDWTRKSLAGAAGVHADVARAHASPSLVDEAARAREKASGSSNDGSIEAHVHIHDGQVRGATARSSGVVKPPRVHLRRGPTMTEPSIST